MRQALITVFCILGLILLAAGCMNIKYVGKHYPATPEQETIAFFNQDDEVPANEYHIIGRAVATAPNSYNSEVIKKAILAKARECGADAVRVVDFKRIFIDRQQLPLINKNVGGPVGNWGVSGRRPNGSYIYVDAGGTVEPLHKVDEKRYKLRARVLFLRKNSRPSLNTMIARKNSPAAEKQPKVSAKAAAPAKKSTDSSASGKSSVKPQSEPGK